MISQELSINFWDSTGPDIIIHQGEKGREIEFIPDIALPNGAAAQIVIVKPDKTFTITNCIIDNYEHIIAEIPEQAGAVIGLAHYIIKITDTDTLVYSASGGLWVDDALLTDAMIESVAEVNGYVFPDDFLTSADLADYVTDSELTTALQPYALAADVPVIVANPSDTATGTLEKLQINNTIYKVKSGIEYSTSEFECGKWIDGRPVYARTFTGSMPQGAGNHILFTVENVAEIDIIINLERTIGISGGGWYFPTVAGVSDRMYFTYNGSTGAFYAIVINDNYTNYYYYITMYYVKREV